MFFFEVVSDALISTCYLDFKTRRPKSFVNKDACKSQEISEDTEEQKETW
jgi:hypothetical protein